MNLRPSKDGLVNLVIVLTCGVIVSALTGHWPAARPAQAGTPNAHFQPGKTAETLPGVRYDDVDATLVLYVRSTCRFCTASMPMYKRLIADLAAHPNARLVVTSPESVDVLNAYLKSNGLQVAGTLTFQSRNEVTPTLLLIDKTGTIRHIWMGQQDARGESEIAQTIAQAVMRAAS